MANENQPHTITSSLASQPISRAVILGRLASHFWRPDFTAKQAELLYGDMVNDLEEFTVEEIDAAATEYRRDASNKFFPRSAQLRALIFEARSDAAKARQSAAKGTVDEQFFRANGYYPPARPILWWMRPREQWPADWRESEVPRDEKVKANGAFRWPHRGDRRTAQTPEQFA